MSHSSGIFKSIKQSVYARRRKEQRHGRHVCRGNVPRRSGILSGGTRMTHPMLL